MVDPTQAAERPDIEAIQRGDRPVLRGHGPRAGVVPALCAYALSVEAERDHLLAALASPATPAEDGGCTMHDECRSPARCRNGCVDEPQVDADGRPLAASLPPAEDGGLRELVERWRVRTGTVDSTDAVTVYRTCADELTAALASRPAPETAYLVLPKGITCGKCGETLDVAGDVIPRLARFIQRNNLPARPAPSGEGDGRLSWSFLADPDGQGGWDWELRHCGPEDDATGRDVPLYGAMDETDPAPMLDEICRLLSAADPAPAPETGSDGGT